MSIREAYNKWADQYDSNLNLTRDLEAIALRSELKDYQFENSLEVGCGTGKNTEFLLTKTNNHTAVDLSEEMLAIAKSKIAASSVKYFQADINEPWNFAHDFFDLVTFSLVLEHVENLDEVFRKLAHHTRIGAHVYIGELHPFKQYTGSKARFETSDGLQIVSCFNHHISDFTNSAKKHGFTIVSINEYFDEDKSVLIPRILTLLFKKN